MQSFTERNRPSEYEIRLLNMRIFEILHGILNLMTKELKGESNYSWEEALAIHDSILQYFNTLNMNDTVLLHLILKRVNILLNLGRLNEAETKIEEAENLINLLLKNKRVLLYMENQYCLLTHLKQKSLRLRAAIS